MKIFKSCEYCCLVGCLIKQFIIELRIRIDINFFEYRIGSIFLQFYLFQMSRWLKFILLAIIIGFVKAHNFMKLVILAALGLAGLWMVHTLAQDFNSIQSNSQNSLNNNNNNNNDGSGLGINIFKRSISEVEKHPNQINWEIILSRDPASCARSFLCQLAALPDKTLSKEESLMLSLVRCVRFSFSQD